MIGEGGSGVRVIGYGCERSGGLMVANFDWVCASFGKEKKAMDLVPGGGAVGR